MFHLTDVDRRKDRKVVRRPNDGPDGTWEERLARSQAALERLNRTKTSANYVEELKDSVPRNLAEARLRTKWLIRAILDGAQSSADAARALGENDYVTRHVIDRAIAKGLITRGVKGDVKSAAGYAIAPLSVTAAGLAFLEEVAP